MLARINQVSNGRLRYFAHMIALISLNADSSLINI